MQTARQLAEAVIPNEYGIDPPQKLRIGSKICSALLGKLLADLANMKDESLATAVSPCMSHDVHAVNMSLTCPKHMDLLCHMVSHHVVRQPHCLGICFVTASRKHCATAWDS